MAWESVIGLECHVQLDTRTKMFCGCPVAFGEAPDANVCPVCLGLPGALPRLNEAAIDAAIRLGLALGCDVREQSVFARKHYFYPDMPKNYQITQYDRPLCEHGALPVRIAGTTKTFALTRIHCEEDAGKTFHPERRGDRKVSRIDFNRAGVPLLELVTEPVFREAAECGAFLAALRRLVRALDLSGGDMEKGQLRCDANVSLRAAGSAAFGVKTEIKNLNSIKAVVKGIESEIERQRAVLESGMRVTQATLLYDADHDRLAVMRTKEDAQDYRYFPEPDLPVLRIGSERLADARARLPELPWAREQRFVEHYALPANDAAVLCEQAGIADYFEGVVREGVEARKACNWVLGKVLEATKQRNWSARELRERISERDLAVIVRAVESVRITGAGGKAIFDAMLDARLRPESMFDRYAATASPDQLLPWVQSTLDEHAEAVRQYQAGKVHVLGFLVGSVIQKSGGQAVPQIVRELLLTELARREGS